MILQHIKPVARPVFQGWQIVSGKSRGTKSRTLCYQNQMDNACVQEKNEVLNMSQDESLAQLKFQEISPP